MMEDDMFDEDYSNPFGGGITYCLGLFLAHQERYSEYKQRFNDIEHSNPEMPEISKTRMKQGFINIWFSGASDHVIDLKTSPKLSEDLNNRLMAFRKKVLGYRGSNEDAATEEAIGRVIDESKTLLFDIDKELGFEPELAIHD